MYLTRALACFMMLFLLGIGGAFAAHGQRPEASSSDLSAEMLKEQISGRNKPAVVDVRSLQEYEFGHIPGAVNIPSPAVKMLSNRLPGDKSTPIIIYGRGDNVSVTDRAYNALYKMGYTNLKLFRGGILDWMDKKYLLKKGGKP